MSLQAALGGNRQRIDDYLAALLDQQPALAPRLLAAMRHGVLLGGKRVRPFLVYATGELLGIAPERLDPVAAAIECIHAYSLIHDDLPAMDNDELRRGQPTVHVAFDEATAVLAGDALQSLAFAELAKVELASAAATRELFLLLAQAAGLPGMCGGQAMDMAATGAPVDLAGLEAIHNHKTGALIKAAVMLPCLLSDEITAEQKARLARYADCIGLAFQVQDDILDVTADTQVLGKTQGKDERDHKATYPSLLGLDRARVKAATLVEEALSSLDALPYNSDKLADLARYIIAREL
ncbi:(2E,6E)-farnesyl diphosphate synthase [Gallaecimonas sp. GXIMD4217]|uniref:(2E,6E)-farnesyl diphosphate synthase n=1 Tax=Gallaecimonas sp. GXIMD4217 TaxID=3131927 RepID=UPI00311B1206